MPDKTDSGAAYNDPLERAKQTSAKVSELEGRINGRPSDPRRCQGRIRIHSREVAQIAQEELRFCAAVSFLLCAYLLNISSSVREF